MNEEPGLGAQTDDAAARAAQSKIAGLSMTVEWTLATHPAVAEVVTTLASCLREPDCVRCFIVPTPGYEPGAALEAALEAHVREALGPNAPPLEIRFVDSLPKTRTGKVMRWVLEEGGEGT
ncbi:MAG: AMP-binding enzyme [Caldilineaceae bacterium]